MIYLDIIYRNTMKILSIIHIIVFYRLPTPVENVDKLTFAW